MNRPFLHIVSLSGGKDSTAMLLMMLEKNMPVDVILFCDTGLEFPDMYKHIEELEKYTGMKITRVKAEHSFEYYFFSVSKYVSRDRTRIERVFSPKYPYEYLDVNKYSGFNRKFAENFYNKLY